MRKKQLLIISVCLTVFNEQNTIEELLLSLFNQALKPSEILICDGGSTDRTVDIIKTLQKAHKNIRLIISLGNVAHGRNEAIKNAKGDIVVCIDAGCSAKKDWLEKMVKGFRMGTKAGTGSGFGTTPSVDIVAGFYEMKYINSFQKIMSLYRGTPPERYNSNTFIPSCRSVAFRKKVWEQLKGFDESLSLSGEDTDFFYRAIKHGYKINKVKNALVYWNEPMRFSLKDFKKFFYYAKGDAQTGIWWDPMKRFRTHNFKIITIYIRYIILISFLTLAIYHLSFAIWTAFCFLLIVYCLWSIWKWRDVVRNWRERMWIPIMQIGTDLMVMAGFLSGLRLQLKK